MQNMQYKEEQEPVESKKCQCSESCPCGCSNEELNGSIAGCPCGHGLMAEIKEGFVSLSDVKSLSYMDWALIITIIYLIYYLVKKPEFQTAY
jgi:hypothetical protein